MNAWQFDNGRSPPEWAQADVDVPQPGPGELLVQVHAAGVTPSELLWYPTTHTKSGGVRRSAVPGHEFSGVVAAIGSDVDFAVGQAVFGMNDWFAEGATAEFCCTLPSSVACKPVRLSHVDAASVPIGTLTAWQGLFDRAKLQPGERVLIHGGSGAVGVLAIQLARWRGAHVLATASQRNVEFLMQLGAERVIDYCNERFEDVAQNVDVIFDTVGGTTLRRSWNLLGAEGRLVTVAASGEATTDERTKQAFFIVEPNRPQLCEIAALLDSGQLRPVIDRVVPFSEAATAYALSPASPRGCGRTVIEVFRSR